MIPVLVLTGFLGSGKTTLLAHLLRQPDFSRTAVIINEFGEIGLDHELVETSDDSLVELTTGCLCCKVRTDLVETLTDLLARRAEGTVAPFTRVVIETSGLADPAPILQTLMTDAGISDRLAVGGVVTTVDAVNGAGTLACEEISVKQVALADQLILTKSDLLEGTDLPEQTAALLLARLASLNAAPLVWADRGKVDPRLFGAASFDARIKSRDIEAWLTGRGGQNGDRHSHDARIGSYAILRHEPIHAVALTLFLEALTEHCGTDLLRLKGIVNVAESPESPAVIHGVQHVFHAPIWLPRWPSDDRRSRIVCITRCVPQGWVEALLDALNAEVAAVSAEQKDVL